MKTKSVFKRYEMKYLVTEKQRELLLHLFHEHMQPDEFGQSSIFSLYCDTDDFLLIRRSLEKPIYKEKLRLRSYGRADCDTRIFLELKKKYDDVVYKRRISLREKDGTDYFAGNYNLPQTQIAKEIDYFRILYPEICPKVMIIYDREAFLAKDDGDFRITFDKNILWRDYDLSLCGGKHGNLILPAGTALMEIKSAGGIPLWLTHFLTENRIYKTSFSKYGTAYTQMKRRKKGQKDAA